MSLPASVSFALGRCFEELLRAERSRMPDGSRRLLGGDMTMRLKPMRHDALGGVVRGAAADERPAECGQNGGECGGTGGAAEGGSRPTRPAEADRASVEEIARVVSRWDRLRRAMGGDEESWNTRQ